mgnify:FL=1
MGRKRGRGRGRGCSLSKISLSTETCLLLWSVSSISCICLSRRPGMWSLAPLCNGCAVLFMYAVLCDVVSCHAVCETQQQFIFLFIFTLCRPCPAQLFAFDFASSSAPVSSEKRPLSPPPPRTVGQLFGLLTAAGAAGAGVSRQQPPPPQQQEDGEGGSRRNKAAAGQMHMPLEEDMVHEGGCLFPEGCASWTHDVSEQDREKEEEEEGVTATVGAARCSRSRSRRVAVMQCLQLHRRVSRLVGGATCVSSALMRAVVAPLLHTATATTTTSTLSDPCPTSTTASHRTPIPGRTPLISLFQWKWTLSSPSSDDGHAEVMVEEMSQGNVSSSRDCDEAKCLLSLSTFEFLFDNLKTTMEQLSDLYQEVYHSFKKQSSRCAGVCLQNIHLAMMAKCPSSSSEPLSSHSPLVGSSSGTGAGYGIKTGGESGCRGSCPFQENVVGTVLSYVESAMRDVIGR